MKKPIGKIFKALLGMVVLLSISYIIYYYVVSFQNWRID